MVRDENAKVTFYADADVKQKLDRLEPGTKSHTINLLLRKGFEGGSTASEQLTVLDSKVRTLENEYRRKSMYNEELHTFCSAFKMVEKTIEVQVRRAGESVMLRLEAHRDEKTNKYSVRAFKQENVTLQPTYPSSNGKFDKKPQDFSIWADWTELPWVVADTADSAFARALSFLSDMCESLIKN